MRPILAALLVAHAGLLAWSAWRHSPVATEVGHLPAGISHWLSGRFDLYRVNPPLVRLVAALPALAADPKLDWGNYSTDPTTRSESLVGTDFVRANGPRSYWLYTIGRWACIPFSLLGAWVCFRWARDLYGPRSGVLAAALWCFCPAVLGNGSLMMPDVPAAAFGVAAGYAFWRWLKEPTWRRAALCGLVLGLAQLTKTTLVTFYLLWPLLWVAYRLPDRPARREWFRQLGMLGGLVLLSVYVLNAGYVFEGSFQALGEYRFKSHALTGRPPGSAHEVGNRFAGGPLAELPVPVPRNYLQGIDAQKIDFERGLPSYLGGQWSDRGWWYFYLYAAAVKVPLGTWVLALLAAVTVRRGVARRDALVLLAPPLVLFALVSSQTGFGIHFRYVLPVFPFAFVWLGRTAPLFAGAGGRVLCVVAWAALAWSVGGSLRYYPHSLAYFNELAGGPERGHECLLESCISWGQDLIFLKEWYDAHPEARPFHFTGSRSVDPRLGWMGFDAVPLVGAAHAWRPGWYAVDVYYLRAPADSAARGLTALRRFAPVARAGYSVYIYHLGPREAEELRREN